MRLVTFAGEIYHSFQIACRLIQRSGSEKSFGKLSQIVCCLFALDCVDLVVEKILLGKIVGVSSIRI